MKDSDFLNLAAINFMAMERKLAFADKAGLPCRKMMQGIIDQIYLK